MPVQLSLQANLGFTPQASASVANSADLPQSA